MKGSFYLAMEREIRPYQSEDYDKLKSWLSELGRFYDGHEAGRFIDQLVNKEQEDEFGYFTTAKEVYVVSEGGQELESIVLNYKRGGSVKVGPFVVDPDARGKGLGTYLLQFAEERAREKGRRKIYATTSHLNEPVNKVFTKCGFKVEAQFPDQYKKGSVELIWGKVLLQPEATVEFTEITTTIESNVAEFRVQPYTPVFYTGFRELILNKLPMWHDEINDEFVLRTIIGHLQGVDFEKKGKVILVANSGNEVLGCSIVVPKRGGPAKLYPVLGTESAQAELIQQSNKLARHIGSHKVYTFAPIEDRKQQQVLESMGFTQRGVIAEPYKPRRDLTCYDKFL